MLLDAAANGHEKEPDPGDAYFRPPEQDVSDASGRDLNKDDRHLDIYAQNARVQTCPHCKNMVLLGTVSSKTQDTH